MKLLPALRIAVLLTLVAAPLRARTWTEASTGRTLEGDFVRIAGSNVVIRLASGSSIEVALARLSSEDQAFVKEQQPSPAVKPGEKPAAKGDLKAQLLGTWDGYMADSDGSRHGDIRLVITEEGITATNPQGERVMGAGTYSVSGETGKLNRIDARGTEGQFSGKSYEGILQLEGKTLKWCSANENPRSKRPTKLQTDPKSGQFLMVLEKK